MMGLFTSTFAIQRTKFATIPIKQYAIILGYLYHLPKVTEMRVIICFILCLVLQMGFNSFTQPVHLFAPEEDTSALRLMYIAIDWRKEESLLLLLGAAF